MSLSEEAWALLGVLHRASKGGPEAPDGFKNAYAELEDQGFSKRKAITLAGQAAWRERFLNTDPRLSREPGSYYGGVPCVCNPETEMPPGFRSIVSTDPRDLTEADLDSLYAFVKKKMPRIPRAIFSEIVTQSAERGVIELGENADGAHVRRLPSRAKAEPALTAYGFNTGKYRRSSPARSRSDVRVRAGLGAPSRVPCRIARHSGIAHG